MRRTRNREGFSVVEILVACIVLTVVAIPLMDLFQSGIRATRAGIDEIEGANLASEMAEQLETLPFDSLAAMCAGGRRFLSSEDSTLVDQTPVAAKEGYVFHLSPLPRRFSRYIVLCLESPDVVMADAVVEWTVQDKRRRMILQRRCLVRDTILPEAP